MNEEDKHLIKKEAQVAEVLNNFHSQVELQEISLDGSKEQEDDFKQAFDVTKRMAKVYTSETNGSVYAAFRREGTTKRSGLSLVVKYPDGQCSEVIDVKQDLIFDMTPITDIKQKNNWVKNAKCLKVLCQYSTADMKIDYVHIYCTLREKYHQIPIIEICERAPLSEVYLRIKNYVSSKKDGVNIYSTCKDYPLTSDDFNKIAIEEGYEAENLLHQLALCDLLIYDGGEKKRWQKSMRPSQKESPIRYYVIKSEEKLKVLSEATSVGIEITPGRVPCPKGVYEKWK